MAAQTIDDLLASRGGDLSGTRVLVRSDLNVPLDGSTITDDGRVRASVPTIQKLAGAGARVLVTAHLGRPKGAPDPAYSLEPVAERLAELLGTPVLTSFSEDGDLWRGRIYDPKSGKDYRSVIRRTSASKLEVKGCLGPFCQTQNWTRAN